MDFIIQVSKKIGLFIDSAVSVFCIEVTDMNFIGIVPYDNQKTYTDDIEHPEFQIVVS